MIHFFGKVWSEMEELVCFSLSQFVFCANKPLMSFHLRWIFVAVHIMQVIIYCHGVETGMTIYFGFCDIVLLDILFCQVHDTKVLREGHRIVFIVVGQCGMLPFFSHRQALLGGSSWEEKMFGSKFSKSLECPHLWRRCVLVGDVIVTVDRGYHDQRQGCAVGRSGRQSVRCLACNEAWKNVLGSHSLNCMSLQGVTLI